MAASANESETRNATDTVAAIDIGSNALRMVIAEVLPGGKIEVLERLQRAVRLGQDAFRRGRLGVQAMRAAVSVLRDYRQLLKLYDVERLRAVATSAAREASNADNFLDRILMATGINVEVIGTSEESRLTVSAVREAVGDVLGINRDRTLVADVGGGSTLLTVLEDGDIATSQSLRLGSVRMQEILAVSQEPPERAAELLRQQIANVSTNLLISLPLKSIQTFVAVGGDARFAAREIGRATESPDLYSILPDDFSAFVSRCVRYRPEELAKKYGLPYAEAETINPALLVYQNLWAQTSAEQMLVSQVSMRDGLLLELARDVTGEEDQSLAEGIIHSAIAIGEKYRIDLDHARNVADLSVALFDELQREHGLNSRYRLLLRVAGLLHEIGGFVSNRSHHKHSYYLIRNTEIFGLKRDEIEIVAHIARYHRRSGPKPSHIEYVALPRDVRVVVNKLAALLRVADALARGHIRQIDDVKFELRGDELLLRVHGAADFMLEQRAIALKGDLFEDIYGIGIRFEEL